MNKIEERFFNAFKTVCKSYYMAQASKYKIKSELRVVEEYIEEENEDEAEQDTLLHSVKITTYIDNVEQYLTNHTMTLESQHKVNDGYEIDFLLTLDYPEINVAIEIDGYEWHERTKEQASRDKERERYLLRNGYNVIRFTGSDIYTKSEDCAKEVLNTFISVFENYMTSTPESFYKYIYNEEKNR